jgi:hypothetical protein
MGRWKYGIFFLLFGISVVIPTTLPPQPMFAQTQEPVGELAKSISVFIQETNRPNIFGSGVIIGRIGTFYTVLTAAHVVDASGDYLLRTHDGAKHRITQVTKLQPELDLAIVRFESASRYTIAKLGDSDKLYLSDSLYVGGFPKGSYGVVDGTFTITPGILSAKLTQGAKDGYTITYSNQTRAGMSGGPVLNQFGEVVAIHGRKVADATDLNGSPTGTGTWVNLGIPINRYTSIQTEFSIAKQPKSSPRQPSAALPPSSRISLADVKPLPFALPKTESSKASSPQEKCIETRINTIVVPCHSHSIVRGETDKRGKLIHDGNQRFADKSYEDAIHSYEAALKLDSKIAVAYFNQGLAYVRVKNNTKAIANFTKAQDLFKSQREASYLEQTEKILQQLQQERS